MVNVTLIETILREQDDPGSSTTRQIRDLYNGRSGDEPIQQHTDEDKEFQRILMKTLELFAGPEESISYTVKLKDADENRTPTVKKRSIIKLSKENSTQSESDEALSDTEKVPTSSSSTKPFSPLFLNNMKKFGVSTDWLTKRSNSAKQSSYSRSSIKSNTSQLDAMIKSASTKPIKSSRKLSFVPPAKSDVDVEEKENIETPRATAYDLSSGSENENENEESTDSKDFALRIPRVDMKDKKKSSPKIDDEKKSQIEHLKKLLRASGIRLIVRKADLDAYSTDEEKIGYLESLLKSEGLSGKSTLKTCEKFREKRATEKELVEIRANVVDVKGHVKAGRTLRGQGRQSEPPISISISTKRKRTRTKEIIELSSSSEDDEEEEAKVQIKRRRIVKTEASPEVSETEWESNAKCD